MGEMDSLMLISKAYPLLFFLDGDFFTSKLCNLPSLLIVLNSVTQCKYTVKKAIIYSMLVELLLVRVGPFPHIDYKYCLVKRKSDLRNISFIGK